VKRVRCFNRERDIAAERNPRGNGNVDLIQPRVLRRQPCSNPRLLNALAQDFINSLDDPLRAAPSLYGKSYEDMDSFYSAAMGLTYNQVVNNAFSFSNADYMRYGGTSFGGSLLVAKQVLSANQGTRFIHIEQGGWDLHQNIYDELRTQRGISMCWHPSSTARCRF
jgi:hypothetical protein